MRHILLIVILLVTLSPALAQSDPLYIECGAEEYLIARYYALQPTNALSDDYYTEEFEFSRDRILGQIYVAMIDLRAFYDDIEEIPDCVQTLHELAIESIDASMDYMALVFIADSTVDEKFAVQAGIRYSDAEDAIEAIEAELMRLGWLDEDGALVDEPPPLD